MTGYNSHNTQAAYRNSEDNQQKGLPRSGKRSAVDFIHEFQACLNRQAIRLHMVTAVVVR